MRNYSDNNLKEAITTLEKLINSEHKDLILDVLSLYMRKKSIERSKIKKASEALKTIITT